MNKEPPGSETDKTHSARSRRAIATAGFIILVSVVAVGVYAWFSLDDTALSDNGYIALAIGVVATMSLGVGLMALVFYSHRYGYDDQAGGEEPDHRD